MENNPNQNTTSNYVGRAVEVVVRIGVLVFIFGWCFRILAPFLSPVIWGLIIAIATFPLFRGIAKRLKGRTGLAAVLITILMLACLVIPVYFLADSLVEGVSYLTEQYKSGHLIPPPDDRVKSWPAIMKPAADIWKLSSENLQAAVLKYGPQLKKVASFLLSFLADTGVGILQFVASIIIAGIFLGYARQGGDTARSIFTRLAGKQGLRFVELSELTIRSVVKGVLGIAVIQTSLAGVGFVVAGVPAAGLWTFCCLLLAIIQIGVGPVAIGVVIYMFATADTLTASLLAAWTVVVTLSDNVLKPLLLGKGTPVPMLVVLLGSLGGFVANGFLGLFLGPVLLSLGYTLFKAWLVTEKSDEATPEIPPPSTP